MNAMKNMLESWKQLAVIVPTGIAETTENIVVLNSRNVYFDCGVFQMQTRGTMDDKINKAVLGDSRIKRGTAVNAEQSSET